MVNITKRWKQLLGALLNGNSIFDTRDSTSALFEQDIPKSRTKKKGRSSQVRNYSPGYSEQAPSRGHEASPQNGLGVGCKLCSSSKKLRRLGVRAQARRISISL